MKKFALVLLALAVALPLVAEDVDIADAKVTIKGDATATWGVDLDDSATGFTNTLNAKMRLNFGLAGDMTGSGMDDGDIYGEVKFDEIEIRSKEANNENDTDATWEMDIDLEYAKIMAPTWWVSVKGPDDNIDFENASQNGIIGIAAAWDKQMDSVGYNIASSGGFEAGVSLPDLATIELSLFSLLDWDSNVDNLYGLKASVSVDAVDALTLEAGVNLPFTDEDWEISSTTATYDWIDDDSDASTAPVWGVDDAAATTSGVYYTAGLGGKVAYEIAVNDDVTIKPEIGADIVLLDGGGMNMAIGNGLTVSLPGDEVKAAEDAIKDVGGTSKAWDDGVNSGINVGWSYYMPDVGDASLGLQAHIGLSMVENLQVALGFEAADIMDEDADMGIAVYGDYTIGDIKPFGGLFMVFDGMMIAEAGVTYTDLVPHTDLLVQYNSGDLSLDEPVLGELTVGVKVKF